MIGSEELTVEIKDNTAMLAPNNNIGHHSCLTYAGQQFFGISTRTTQTVNVI